MKHIQNEYNIHIGTISNNEKLIPLLFIFKMTEINLKKLNSIIEK